MFGVLLVVSKEVIHIFEKTNYLIIKDFWQQLVNEREEQVETGKSSE